MRYLLHLSKKRSLVGGYVSMFRLISRCDHDISLFKFVEQKCARLLGELLKIDEVEWALDIRFLFTQFSFVIYPFSISLGADHLILDTSRNIIYVL